MCFEHKRRIVLNTKTIRRNVRHALPYQKTESAFNFVSRKYLISKDIINRIVGKVVFLAEFQVSIIVLNRMPTPKVFEAFISHRLKACTKTIDKAKSL